MRRRWRDDQVLDHRNTDLLEPSTKLLESVSMGDVGCCIHTQF